MSSPSNRLHIVSCQDSVTVGPRTLEFLRAVQFSLPVDGRPYRVDNAYMLAEAEQRCLRTGDLEAVQALRTYRKLNQHLSPDRFAGAAKKPVWSDEPHKTALHNGLSQPLGARFLRLVRSQHGPAVRPNQNLP